MTVIVPEFVPTKWWHSLLHGNSGLLLKIALLGRKDVIVTNVRYYLQHMDEPPSMDALAEEVAPFVPAEPAELLASDALSAEPSEWVPAAQIPSRHGEEDRDY